MTPRRRPRHASPVDAVPAERHRPQSPSIGAARTAEGEIQGKHKTFINTNDLAKGAYFLKVYANDAIEIKKVIIQ